MRDALDTSHEVIKLIKKFPHRNAALQKIKEQCPYTVSSELLRILYMGAQVLRPIRYEQSVLAYLHGYYVNICIFI